MAKSDTATRMAEWICLAVVGTRINRVPKYRCNICGAEFDEPRKEWVSASRYYGVSRDFGDCGTVEIATCPRCHDEDFEEIEEYEEGEEE